MCYRTGALLTLTYSIELSHSLKLTLLLTLEFSLYNEDSDYEDLSQCPPQSADTSILKLLQIIITKLN